MPQKKKKASLYVRRARARMFMLGGTFALLILFIIGVAFVSRLPEVTIANLEITGANIVRAGDAEKTIWQELAGSYFFIVPHKNVLFYPKKDIAEKLSADFLPVKDVTVSRTSLTSLVVAIDEREPVARWCQTMDASSTNCWLLDETGLIFAPASVGHENLFVYEGDALKAGDTYLSGSFPTLRAFIEKLPAATQRTPERVFVDENSDVFVHFKEGGELRMTLDFDEGSLLQNIASVFSSKRFTSGEAFEYVDFRFGNKVYVKFVGE